MEFLLIFNSSQEDAILVELILKPAKLFKKIKLLKIIKKFRDDLQNLLCSSMEHPSFVP